MESVKQFLSGCVLQYAGSGYVVYPSCPSVQYVRRIREVLHTDISSESSMLDLSRCCLQRLFNFVYLIGRVDTQGRDLGLELRHRSKGLLFGRHNIKIFAVPSERRGLGYAAKLSFMHDLEGLRWFLVATLLWCFYFLRLRVTNISSLTSRCGCLAMFEFVVRTIDAFIHTVYYGRVPRYANVRMRWGVRAWTWLLRWDCVAGRWN